MLGRCGAYLDQTLFHNDEVIRHPCGSDLLDFFGTGYVISKLFVEGRELGAMIQDADVNSLASGAAAEVFSLFDQCSAESETLRIRIDRQQAEVTRLAAQFDIIAARDLLIALRKQKLSFLEMFE